MGRGYTEVGTIVIAKMHRTHRSLIYNQETFRHFVKKESLKLQAKSSLTLFCRLDIGIIPTSGGTVNYLVNEVEQTPTTSQSMVTQF